MERLDTLREAQAALARAIQLNPLLQREYGESLRQAGEGIARMEAAGTARE